MTLYSISLWQAYEKRIAAKAKYLADRKAAREAAKLAAAKSKRVREEEARMLADESKLSIEGSIHSGFPGKDDLNCGDDASSLSTLSQGPRFEGNRRAAPLVRPANGHVGSESSMNAKTMKNGGSKGLPPLVR